MPSDVSASPVDIGSETARQDELVSPHQTTLLKLLDSYLQPSQERELAVDSSELRELSDFLIKQFFLLATYTQHSIQRALGSNNASCPQRSGGDHSGGAASTANSAQDITTAPSDTGGLQELDLLLPKVCEALVLVTQCLTSLSLISEETFSGSPSVSHFAGDRATREHLKDRISSSVASAGKGLVECLIGAINPVGPG